MSQIQKYFFASWWVRLFLYSKAKKRPGGEDQLRGDYKKVFSSKLIFSTRDRKAHFSLKA